MLAPFGVIGWAAIGLNMILVRVISYLDLFQVEYLMMSLIHGYENSVST